jgi:hypothetical protein
MSINNLRTAIYILIVIALASCASIDGQLTKFEPLRQDNGLQIYKFTTSANAIYPLKSEEAEKTRIQWLETWLIKNGLDNKNYEILSKKVVKSEEGLIGDNYHLYYEVKTREK